MSKRMGRIVMSQQKAAEYDTHVAKERGRRRREKKKERRETMEGGSSRQGVRLSHSVTGSMLTRSSFGLLTMYICVRPQPI